MKVTLTKNDAQECQHKLGVLADTPDLQEDYQINQEQANALRDSIPANGGEWEIPIWAREIVCGEMRNHAEVLRDISEDARSGGDVGASLRIAKQAKKFETMFL